MLKKSQLLIVALSVSIGLSSCYSYTNVVGKGPQQNQTVTKWNHYVIGGLAPVGLSDATQMAGGATDYSVNTKLSFVNALIGAVTFGIYTPTTTTVKK